MGQRTAVRPCRAADTGRGPRGEVAIQGRETGCGPPRADPPPYPRRGQLAECLNSPLSALRRQGGSARAAVCRDDVAALECREGCLVQTGSGPHSQGGTIALRTCKPAVRAFLGGDARRGTWVAGFTDVAARGGTTSSSTSCGWRSATSTSSAGPGSHGSTARPAIPADVRHTANNAPAAPERRRGGRRGAARGDAQGGGPPDHQRDA